MDSKYVDKLTDSATSIWKFVQLHPDEQKWLMPILSEGAVTTIKLLELLEQSPLTFEEIAIELGQNINSVKQRVKALVDAGIPLSLNDKVYFCSTGRPRKLIQNSKEN